MKQEIVEKLNKELEKQIDAITKEGIQTNNIEMLDMLVDIHKDIANEEYWNRKESNMYGDYGRGYGGYGNQYGENYREYGRENYGARGRDMRYRGDDYMNRMSNEYGRYMEARERYGAGEETEKAFHFMTKALGEYLDFLHEEADSPQKKQMLNETLQRSMR